MPGNQRGFTLLESIVVAVLVGVTVLTSVVLVRERVRAARIRVATKQFAIDLRSARLNAVSHRNTVDVVVVADPANTYRFTDSRGRSRTVQMPEGVRIVSSTSPIRFRPNGSVPGGATTVFETELTSRTVERWTVTTALLGVPRIDNVRTNP